MDCLIYIQCLVLWLYQQLPSKMAAANVAYLQARKCVRVCDGPSSPA